MSGEKRALIKPLMNQLLASGDIHSWRTSLADQGVMSLEETMALDETACRAAFQAMKMTQLLGASSDQLMMELERHQVSWSIDLPEDLQQGAICY